MPSRRRRRAEAICVAALLVAAPLGPDARAAMSEAPLLRGAMLGEGVDLYLEVLLNGRPVGLVAAFHLAADGALTIAPDELEEIGLRADPASMGADGQVIVARLPGVGASYDAAAQQVRFTASPAALAPHRIEAAPRLAAVPPVAEDMGVVVNYTVYAAGGGKGRWRFEGVSGLLEGRAFGPYGLISGAVLARSTGPGRRVRRLETAWSWSDPEGPTTWAAGDVVTGALAWSRPVRLGGVQVRRNFALRPDILTQPSLDLRGSADVPSTVEVYVDGARRLVTEVPDGPFEISDLPLTTGAGTARVVVRDALGRSYVAETPFYAAAAMLAPGLFDLSFEIGAPRRDFGGETDSYDRRIFASGSLRYGVSDRLTLEGHAEGGGDLLMGGAGLVTRLGAWGALSLAAAASRHDGRTGTRVHGGLEVALGDLRVFALSQRSSEGFADIASVSALHGYAAPPRALDQIAVAIPEPWEGAAVTVSYARLARRGEQAVEIASASFSQDIAGAATLFVSAFAELGARGGSGVFAGLSVPLGGSRGMAATVSHQGGRTAVAGEIWRAESGEPGSLGWRVRAGEDAQAARASYRAVFARLEGSVWRGREGVHASAQAEGAIVLTGGGVFAAPRIEDAFAVVETGTPGVTVKLENRPAGRTGRSGRLLVPGLRAYERNRLAIDPDDLPAGADISAVVREVTPADRAGAHVDFTVTVRPAAVLVTLRHADGAFVAPGATARLEASGADFAVGYDGEVYVTGLAQMNRLRVTAPDGRACLAAFAFRRDEGLAMQREAATCRG